MKFLGNDRQFSALRDSQENLVSTLLMNAYNEGYTACSNNVSDLFEQAKQAIVQGLDVHMLAGNNPFIDILVEYIDQPPKKQNKKAD